MVGELSSKILRCNLRRAVCGGLREMNVEWVLRARRDSHLKNQPGQVTVFGTSDSKLDNWWKRHEV